jgi:prephenate dehydrogenase
MKIPLVIGYKGEIGRYILDGLLSFFPKADNIWCIDVDSSDSEFRNKLHMSDVVFLCIPLNKTEQWIDKNKSFLRDKIVVEQTSLKTWVPKWKSVLELKYNCKLVSMHIMFRPSATPDVKDRKIAIICKNQTVETTLIKNFITEVFKCKVVYYSNVIEHDVAMATQQALVHRVILCLDEAMRTEAPSTYVSMKLRELANRICKGDVELYESIQSNVHLKAQIQNFNKKMAGFKIRKYFPGSVVNNAKAK